MSWKLVSTRSGATTLIGGYKIQSERDGDQTAHLVTFPDDRQIRVLPDSVHSGQYRIQVVKVALKAMAALTADSGSLPAGYDPALYLYGSLCYADLEWEQVWEGPTINEWLESWFIVAETTGDSFMIAVPKLLHDLKKAGWVIRRVDD
jgi:hypothetical protein